MFSSSFVCTQSNVFLSFAEWETEWLSSCCVKKYVRKHTLYKEKLRTESITCWKVQAGELSTHNHLHGRNFSLFHTFHTSKEQLWRSEEHTNVSISRSFLQKVHRRQSQKFGGTAYRSYICIRAHSHLAQWFCTSWKHDTRLKAYCRRMIATYNHIPTWGEPDVSIMRCSDWFLRRQQETSEAFSYIVTFDLHVLRVCVLVLIHEQPYHANSHHFQLWRGQGTTPCLYGIEHSHWSNSLDCVRHICLASVRILQC